jgi:hypothetical protein
MSGGLPDGGGSTKEISYGHNKDTTNMNTDMYLLFGLPFAAGMANAGVGAYYNNALPTADIDDTHGTLSGTSGSMLMAFGGVALGLQTLSLSKCFLHCMNRRNEGDCSKLWFWRAFAMFFAISFLYALMNMVMVSNFSALKVTVGSNGVVKGAYGITMQTLDYATIALGLTAMGLFCGYHFNVISEHDTTDRGDTELTSTRKTRRRSSKTEL